MQHDIPMMKDADQAARRFDIRRMRFGHRRQPDVTTFGIDRDHLGLGAKRKFAAEFRERYVGVHGTSGRIRRRTVRSRIQPTSAALRMVSPRSLNRHVANE